MAKRLLYLLLLIAGSQTVFAQLKGKDKVDSLLKVLHGAKEDTNKVNLLNAISWEYRSIDPNEGIKYSELTLAKARELGWKKGQALAFKILGINYYTKNDYRKAIDIYDSCLIMYRAINDKEGIAAVMANTGLVYEVLGYYAKALEYYLDALEIKEEIGGDKKNMATILSNIGNLYLRQKVFNKAMEYHNKSLEIYKELGDKDGVAIVLNSLGTIYMEQEDYKTALEKYGEALKISEENGLKRTMTFPLANIGDIYTKQKRYKEAMSCFTRAINIAMETGDKRRLASANASIGQMYVGMTVDSNLRIDGRGSISNMKAYNLQKGISSLNIAIEMYRSLEMIGSLPEQYQYLSEAYRRSGNYKSAYDAQQQYIIYKDSVFGIENAEKITQMELESEFQRKQLADSLKNIEAQKLSALELQKQKTYTYVGAGIGLLLLGFSFFIVRERGRSEKARNQAEGLLLNILPSEVADELKERGATTARHFDNVTVLFTDFVNFTGAGERMGTQKLVEELHTCFKAFDEIISKYNIEKIKTIGDAYLAVSGLPVPDSGHAQNVMNAAMEVKAFMLQRRRALGNDTFEVRIGIHSDPVVAGIVGVKKFAYDIWGDTVNTAARMEQNSEAGKINISQTTYDIVKDKYSCTYRGEIEAKNKGMLKMYFVEGAII